MADLLLADEALEPAALDDDVLVPAPLELAAAPLPVPFCGGIQGLPGPPGVGLVVVEIDGADVPLPVLPSLAIARDAVAPNLGTLHALAWSSVISAPVVWTGTMWKELAGGGTAPVDPLQLTSDQGELLVNDQGEVVTVG